MHEIFDGDGNSIGSIELSQKQQRLLEEEGASVVTLFHTPRMLQQVLGNENGSFEISRNDDRLVVRPDSINGLKRYIAMQMQIKRTEPTAASVKASAEQADASTEAAGSAR